ncbi:MAG: hydroxymethylglutaryl-CoA lyase [Bdellovibrionaceae bacterium]|nr:hydroxymethylglutaryl-CoA lyase [Pseudobdellovibrionaceae bacterium]
MKKAVRIVDVSLRDGLQNEATPVSTANRVLLAERLIAAGVTRMELGAFVRVEKIPQMAGSMDVITKTLKHFPDQKKYGFAALVPNQKGMDDALKSGIKEVAIFTAASNSFTKANINCTIDESFERFADVMAAAKKNKIKVRGYLSTCFGCPYEGEVDEKVVVKMAERLYAIGCYEVSIGDTIGVANPAQVVRVFEKLAKKIPMAKLAGHFHDTRGTALANILAAYQTGVRVFDASLGGIGGCPYAPGAAGNVALEDVIYMFNGMKVDTGLDLRQLVDTNHWFAEIMGKKLNSKMSFAGLPKTRPS